MNQLPELKADDFDPEILIGGKVRGEFFYSADAYMQDALSTALLDRHVNDQLENAAYGLGGEAGEILEHIKKWRFHDHQLDTDYLRKELGDLQWYICLAAWALQVPLSEIMRENLYKLAERYKQPDGTVKFSFEQSQNRSE